MRLRTFGSLLAGLLLGTTATAVAAHYGAVGMPASATSELVVAMR